MNDIRSIIFAVQRICHTIAHFLATLVFFAERRFIKLEQIEQIKTLMPLVSATGYAIWTTSLVWERVYEETNEQFTSDLGVHLGGFFFEALPLLKNVESFAPYSFMTSNSQLSPGLCMRVVLWTASLPQDRTPVEAEFSLDDDHHEVPHSPRESCDHHGHAHAHG